MYTVTAETEGQGEEQTKEGTQGGKENIESQTENLRETAGSGLQLVT